LLAGHGKIRPRHFATGRTQEDPMKKQVLAGVLALALLPAAARAATIGIGAYGGSSIPLVQEDNGSGSMYGLRVPVGLIPMVTVEPFYASTSGGSKSQTAAGVTLTRDGIDVTSYGANLLLTFGGVVQMFPFAGVSSNHLKRAGLDATQTGYDFGLGLGFKLPLVGLSANVRGAANIVTDPASTEASRKWGEVTVGVAYNLFKFPPVVP
jgi:hypothetical protein